jgi:hypothetical protein
MGLGKLTGGGPKKPAPAQTGSGSLLQSAMSHIMGRKKTGKNGNGVSPSSSAAYNEPYYEKTE